MYEVIYQVPTALRDLGDLCDGFHLLDAADAHFRNPESAADVGPLLAGLGCLHGATLVGTEFALGFDAQGAGSAEPGARGDVGDSVAGLVNTNVAFVAEHHLVAFFRVGLKKNIELLNVGTQCGSKKWTSPVFRWPNVV